MISKIPLDATHWTRSWHDPVILKPAINVRNGKESPDHQCLVWSEVDQGWAFHHHLHNRDLLKASFVFPLRKIELHHCANDVVRFVDSTDGFSQLIATLEIADNDKAKEIIEAVFLKLSCVK